MAENMFYFTFIFLNVCPASFGSKMGRALHIELNVAHHCLSHVVYQMRLSFKKEHFNRFLVLMVHKWYIYYLWVKVCVWCTAES